jgi:UDP-N-acetylmuramoyl-tripeptide--D-alanyl-D-alanine ligase
MKARFATTLGEAAALCGGSVLCGDPGLEIRSVTSDSRDLGEASLFVPIAGERFDGHDFIASLASEKKIAAFLTMNSAHRDLARETGAGAILCQDSLAALGSLASGHRARINPRVIGITGTNGKTTTKELVHAMGGRKFHALKNIKNYNNEIGVPFTLLGLEPAHRVAVIEMGMNHSGELERLSRMTRPDLAVITNVGEGHLEFLGSVENVARAKAEIMRGMSPGSTIVLNRDTECFDILAERARAADVRVHTFSLEGEADYRPSAYRLFSNSIEVDFGGCTFAAPLYGIHNVYNLVAALAVALEWGINPEEIERSLVSFAGVAGRSEIIKGDYCVIDDTYNANPLSTRYALRSAAEVFVHHRKIAVLSDMKELGPHGPSFHIACGAEAARRGMDMLFLWGDMAEQYRDGALGAGMPEASVRVFETKDDLCRSLKGEIRGGDVVLVKGSRSMKMEEIVREITG